MAVRPVQVGGHWQIVNVGWGGRGATLSFSFHNNSSVPLGQSSPQFQASITESNVSGLRGKLVTGEIGPVVAPPRAGAQIRRDNNFWCYQPRSTHEVTTETQNYQIIERGLYDVYTNTGVITSLVDPLFGNIVPFYIDYTGDLSGGGAYDVIGPAQIDAKMQEVYNLADPETKAHLTTLFPQLRQIISSHTESVSVTVDDIAGKTQTFFNLPRIKRSELSNSNQLRLTLVMSGIQLRQVLQWAVTLATWKAVVGFQVDSNFDLVPVPSSKQPISLRTEDAFLIPEVPLPARRVDFTIDLRTLEVTSSQQDA